MTGSLSTAVVLGALSAPTWRCLHGVRLTDPGRGTAVTVPHVAVGPGGVFVVDLCGWSGCVWLEEGRLLREVPTSPLTGSAEARAGEAWAGATGGAQVSAPSGAGGTVVVEAGDEVVARAEQLADRVRGVLPGHLAQHVRAVLCLTHSDRVRGRSGDVVVCASLALPFVLQSRPPVLARDETDEALALLCAVSGTEPPVADTVLEDTPAPAVPLPRPRGGADPVTEEVVVADPTEPVAQDPVAQDLATEPVEDQEGPEDPEDPEDPEEPAAPAEPVELAEPVDVVPAAGPPAAPTRAGSPRLRRPHRQPPPKRRAAPRRRWPWTG